MRRFFQKSDALFRPVSPRHYGAAAVALLVSIILHISVLTNVGEIPLLSTVSQVEHKRFVKIEMADVRTTPPAKEETLERQPLDAPAVDIPNRDADSDVWTEISPPEPVRLPLPEPVAEPAQIKQAENPADLPPALRQEVLSIPEQLFSEEDSALPRRWIEKDIPRIDQAPDIQLPVELAAAGEQKYEFKASQAASFIEDMESGTPDWSVAMSQRHVTDGADPLFDRMRQLSGVAGMLSERPENVSSLSPIEDLLQIKVVGYPVKSENATYIAIYIERASENLLTVQPRDVLFIQDSSESMTPQKLDECRRGLKRWLDFLNPGDRFDVMGFRDSTYSCFNGWQEINEASRKKAVRFIEEMRAVGNTDVYRSLESALSFQPDPARTPIYVLITDGRPTVGVTGSSEIIEGITQFNRGRVSIFSIGGGKKVNSFFLDLISYRNRGEAIVVRGDEEIPQAMETWARQFQRPVLTDLSYSFSQVDSSEIYPKQLTHLFLDRPLVIYGKIPDSSEKPLFQIVGRSNNQWHDMVFAIDRNRIIPGDDSIRTTWAWQKIYHLIGGYLGSPTEDRLESIRAFADRYGLIVPYGFSRALPRGSSN
jgi:hypothetical protein